MPLCISANCCCGPKRIFSLLLSAPWLFFFSNVFVKGVARVVRCALNKYSCTGFKCLFSALELPSIVCHVILVSNPSCLHLPNFRAAEASACGRLLAWGRAQCQQPAQLLRGAQVPELLCDTVVPQWGGTGHSYPVPASAK